MNLTLISTWIRDPEVAQWAASVLTQSWRSRLSESYPNYTFAIETLVDEDDVAVTFTDRWVDKSSQIGLSKFALLG